MAATTKTYGKQARRKHRRSEASFEQVLQEENGASGAKKSRPNSRNVSRAEGKVRFTFILEFTRRKIKCCKSFDYIRMEKHSVAYWKLWARILLIWAHLTLDLS